MAVVNQQKPKRHDGGGIKISFPLNETISAAEERTAKMRARRMKKPSKAGKTNGWRRAERKNPAGPSKLVKGRR